MKKKILESNVQDLMLRKDVVRAVQDGKCHICAIKTIDQGIEILTGKAPGAMQPEGGYFEGTINFLVDQKLRDLSEGLKRFSAGAQEADQCQPAHHKDCC